MKLLFMCKSFSYFPSAIDIKDLKILELPNSHLTTGLAQSSVFTSSNLSHIAYSSQNGAGKGVKKPNSSGTAPQAIPRRAELKVQDLVTSPQQYSKSYVDRHMDSALTPSKAFRRRHNSCEYMGMGLL